MQHLAAVCIVGEGDIRDADAGTLLKADGFAVGLRWFLLEFQQTLCSSEAADDGGDEACQLAEGTLYLAAELDESGHHAKGDDALRKAVDAPQEGEQIGRAEADVQHQIRGGGEQGAMAHLLAQRSLLLRERPQHQRHTLQRLQHQTVLDALLQHRLYAAVGVAHLACDIAHPVDIEAAEEYEDGQDDGDAHGQHRIHRIQEKEGTNEAHDDGQRLWQGICDHGDYGLAVADEAIEHIAAVAHLPAVPFAAQQMFKDATLHTVLGLHA